MNSKRCLRFIEGAFHAFQVARCTDVAEVFRGSHAMTLVVNIPCVQRGEYIAPHTVTSKHCDTETEPQFRDDARAGGLQSTVTLC